MVVESVCFDVVTNGTRSSLDMLFSYPISSRPVVLDASFTSDWMATTEWVIDEAPNEQFLRNTYGDETVPVICSKSGSCSEMKFHEYLDYCSSPEVDNGGSFYLKDWHFQQRCGDNMYSMPLFLKSDWLNDEKWSKEPTNPVDGDYRFMYYGKKGTWTKFHSDVMSSHSWSANICGRKLWYFVPPGNEGWFLQGKNFVEDIREKQHLWAEANVITLVQEVGQIVFVPSNWHHQVHNLETAISLNHNCINATNVHLLLDFISRRIHEVRAELRDLDDILSPEEMEEQVQALLYADARMNVPRLRSLLQLVIEDRSSMPDAQCFVCPRHGSDFIEKCPSNPHCAKMFRQLCRCQQSDGCSNCRYILHSIDLTVACITMTKLDNM